jgi:hypothetical protein
MCNGVALQPLLQEVPLFLWGGLVT